jgi:hypothetical protein
MGASEQGRKMLDAVKITSPIRADYKRDYSLFAEFDFERLEKHQTR